jgi:signal transduction histidine kinase
VTSRAPSLALRLALYLLFAQVLGALATVLAIELFIEDDAFVFTQKNLSELAGPRIYNLIYSSLHRSPSGALYLDPSAHMLAEMKRAPTMMFAAFDPKTLAPLPGSSAELAQELSGLNRLRVSHMHFKIDGDSRENAIGHMSSADTPFGPLTIAIYGHQFLWVDLFYSLAWEVSSYLRYFVFEALAAVGVGWLAFKRGLAPLERVAREAERIDLDSLHQRLSLNEVPAEVTSLVTSVNGALKRLDEGAERQRRFLANAAHELRTPVAILMERLEEPLDAALASKLRRDAQRIRNLVEQLLASVRLDRKESRADETFDLGKFLETIVDDHALLAIKMKRALALETHGENQFLTTDRDALQSVLANLIYNALRAEPAGGVVVVQVEENGAISVVDHGEGVDPADREAVFEPFWRKNKTSSGTGLGLAIARELVGKLGGRIWVEETPGGGATFKLWLSTNG